MNMRTVLFVTLVLSLSAVVSGQVLINEIETGTTDAFELLNIGAAPQSLTGWRVEYGGLNPSLVWTAGTFNFPGGASMAAGELVALRESASSPIVAPGTTIYMVATNINWATTGGGQTRGGDCNLLDNTGTSVDLVRWLNAVAPNQFGGVFSGTYNPNATAYSRQNYIDNDNAGDWADEPLGLGVLSQGQLSLVNVLDLSMTTTGIGDLSWIVTSSNPAVPGGEIYNLVSFQNFAPDGSGPLFGVGFDAVVLFAQPVSPTNVFHTNLDGSGQWTLAVPAGVLPGGLFVESVSILLGGGGVDRVSNVASVTF